jgi:hypothetical protein
MPNWAYNYLTVSGPVEALDKWRIALANEKDMTPRLLFNKLLPLPPEEEENWYNWRVENWGTKWDIGDEHGVEPDVENHSEYFYDFETAWSPPLELFATIAGDFPGVRFELGWYEEQMYFGGLLIIEDGVIVKNDYKEYDEFYGWAEDYFGLDFRDYDEEWGDE